MATAFVQANAANSASSPWSTAGITTTSGNALAASVAIYNVGNTLTSITDNKSNVWTQVANSPLAIPSGNIQIAVFTATNITGGAGHTFTATNSNSADGGTLLVAELSGCSIATLVRATATFTNTAGSQSHAGATVLAGAGDIVIALSTDDNRATDTFTAGLGFTIPAAGEITAAAPTGFIQYVANVGGGNVTGAYTTTAYASSAQIIIALVAPAAGGIEEQMLMGVG